MSVDDWDGMPDLSSPESGGSEDGRGLIAAMRRAMDTRLTPRQREVFTAVVLNGVSCAAVAEQLDISRNAVHQTLFVARDKLRVALRADGYVAGPARGVVTEHGRVASAG